MPLRALRNRRFEVFFAAFALIGAPFAAASIAGCGGGSDTTEHPKDAGPSEDAGGGGGGGDAGTTEYPACEGPEPKGAPFAEGPYGYGSRELADDFTVPTTDGDWSFKEHWTGCDSFIFVNYAEGYEYAEGLWTTNPDKLFQKSPANVHYFFMSFANDDATVLSDVEKIKAKVEASLAKLTPEEQMAWQGRFHFVTKGAFDLDNWIGDKLNAKGEFAFAIDRFQRVRQVGLLLAPTSGSQLGKLEYVAHEAQYFNFEWTREQALAAEKNPTIIEVLKQETAMYDVDVALPDAEAMKGFDTMEIDLTLACTDHLDENCGEWDYIANLFLCDKVDPTMCPTEVGRWITTYHREGRWVTDVSPLLAFIKDGGTRRFHLNPANAYVVDMSFRFLNKGKGSTPDEATYLYSGAGFNQTYNDNFMPVTFDVPADVKKVEIAAFITGHGWGVEADNCAEFCNHDHHFTVNGTDHVKDHPMAGTSDGCMKQIPDGSVPNQFGTWPLGRGGWCPGLDVKPWVVDVTSDVTIGGTNTLTYKGLFKGMTYVPKPGNPNSGGFGANITMTSWLIYSR